MAVRTPTAWQPPSGNGYIITNGNLGIVTNLGLPIVDNTSNHYPIVTTPTYAIPKYATAWTASGV